MLSSLLTLFIVGFVALLGIGIVLALLGAMVGLALLIFKVAPLLLVGYLVIRFLCAEAEAAYGLARGRTALRAKANPPHAWPHLRINYELRIVDFEL
jgi:hypothetical protein